MIRRAAFLGSKKFGLEIFKALHRAGNGVGWSVLCPPDDNDARTHLEEFRSYTASRGIDFQIAGTPKAILQFACDAKPDVMIVCGYYRLLPDEIFAEVREGVWGIHNSLLPKYRGGSPLVWQIINGEETIGSSFFRFASGIDDGPVLQQVSLHNASRLTIGEAMDALELEWIRRLPSIWRGFCEGSIRPQEQDHSAATYCALRNEGDGEIDWHKDADTIDRFVRAQAAPYPRAFFIHDGRKVRVVRHEVDTRLIYGAIGQVFEISNVHVTVCCGQNTAMRLIEVEVDGTCAPAGDILNSIKIRL